jgi:hypothetical protein
MVVILNPSKNGKSIGHQRTDYDNDSECTAFWVREKITSQSWKYQPVFTGYKNTPIDLIIPS